ncbi:hypothetical protein SDC9_164961 [bioreactor metagenome]|uniref:Uncharacterized protein n=1 Tax=bioreactor metagenome TaxID=1076179 RepID=A0A645FUY5_9ZZZZ
MHGRGIDVIARLALVHVIVGVHQARFATLAAQQFAGALGQHLVDVHVGLRARARLPDHQRELVRMLSTNHLVRRSHDGLGLFLVEQSQLLIHRGRRALDLRERMDDFLRLSLAADLEILNRALRLRTPQLVRGNVDQTESVFLLPDSSHGKTP